MPRRPAAKNIDSGGTQSSTEVIGNVVVCYRNTAVVDRGGSPCGEDRIRRKVRAGRRDDIVSDDIAVVTGGRARGEEDSPRGNACLRALNRAVLNGVVGRVVDEADCGASRVSVGIA